jgi:hypothetical protein
MTPKEKAIELVDKFYQTTPNEAWINEPLGCTQNYKSWNQSKQCALIAADEVIEFMEADDFDSDTCYWANHSKMQYWTEVKQEIENK